MGNTPEIETLELIYATDPLCSFCWAYEPVLRKFQYQYGHYFTARTISMGGMIESFQKFSRDDQKGIHKPEEIARHWREVGTFMRMPIDGSIWLDNPIASSYPSSQVFEIVRRDYPEKAPLFLRKVREKVMLWNQDIANEQVIASILEEIKVDTQSVLQAAKSQEGLLLLDEDIQLTKDLQVSGFPTVLFILNGQWGIKLAGTQAYESLVSALQQLLDLEEPPQPALVPSIDFVFADYPLLLSKEIEVLYDMPEEEVRQYVNFIMGPDQVEEDKILGQMYYRAVGK